MSSNRAVENYKNINSKIKMQKPKLKLEIFCTKCDSVKYSKYCDVCRCETPNLYKKQISVVAKTDAKGKQYMKSEEKVQNKPKKEIEQWASKEGKDVITRYERIREEGKLTKVVHSLWRKINSFWKKVHEDEK